METYPIDTKVIWKWGNGHATGYVKEQYRSPITLSIKDAEVTRNASREDPAYRIEQDDGDILLKLHSELSRPE